MNSPSHRIRRATVEDLAVLRSLWEDMRLSAADLEKRIIEFQVAETSEGKVVGAIGFLMKGRQGWIHSEVFSDFGTADAVRPMFWDRLRVLASNHGVFRVWTREEAPFWKQNGLQPATPEWLNKLPPEWPGADQSWLTLQLKNEEAILSVEKEVEMLMMTEKDRTTRTLEQAKRLKNGITAAALAIFLLLLAIAIFLFVRHRAGMVLPQ